MESSTYQLNKNMQRFQKVDRMPNVRETASTLQRCTKANATKSPSGKVLIQGLKPYGPTSSTRQAVRHVLNAKQKTNSIKDWTDSSNDDFFLSGGADLYKNQNQFYNHIKRKRLLDGCVPPSHLSTSQYRSRGAVEGFPSAKHASSQIQQTSPYGKQQAGLKFVFINRGKHPASTLRDEQRPPRAPTAEEDKFMTI